MKKLFYAVLFLFIFNLAGSAQVDYQIHRALDFYREKKTTLGEFGKQKTYKDINGSPYLKAGFSIGSVYMTSNIIYNGIALRYDIYKDNLEFKSPEDKILSLAAPWTIEKAKFSGITLAYIPYNSAGKIRRGFFTLLEDGAVKLYSRAVIQFEPAKDPGAYTEAKAAEFQRKSDVYYIRVGQEAAEKVKGKKELVSIFPDHKDELTVYLKKHKIKTGKADSLKELVHYYNSL